MMTFDVAQLLIFGIVCGVAGYSIGSWADERANERITRKWSDTRKQCEALQRDAAATYAKAKRLLDEANAKR